MADRKRKSETVYLLEETGDSRNVVSPAAKVKLMKYSPRLRSIRFVEKKK